jgi:hypothetical protein
MKIYTEGKQIAATIGEQSVTSSRNINRRMTTRGRNINTKFQKTPLPSFSSQLKIKQIQLENQYETGRYAIISHGLVIHCYH